MVKCSAGHDNKSLKDSSHPIKLTSHPNVYVIGCKECGTSVHVYVGRGSKIERRPTDKELKMIYGIE